MSGRFLWKAGAKELSQRVKKENKRLEGALFFSMVYIYYFVFKNSFLKEWLIQAFTFQLLATESYKAGLWLKEINRAMLMQGEATSTVLSLFLQLVRNISSSISSSGPL